MAHYNGIHESSVVDRWMHKFKLTRPFHRVLGTYAHRLQNSKKNSEVPPGVTKWFIPFVLHRVLRILPTCECYRSLLNSCVDNQAGATGFVFFSFSFFFNLISPSFCRRRWIRSSRVVETSGNLGRRPILASVGDLCRPMRHVCLD